MRSPADPPFGESRSLSVALSRTAAEGVFRLKKRSTAAAGGYLQPREHWALALEPPSGPMGTTPLGRRVFGGTCPPTDALRTPTHTYLPSRRAAGGPSRSAAEAHQ